MCGIIGILGKAEAVPLLVDGLKRLEYRGYDSAGIATLVNGRIKRRRAKGKLVNLEEKLKTRPIGGTTGIGHTRWATHGAPSEENAHPHMTDRVAVVHNGIIENFHELRAELEADGAAFETETDTEVVVHLLTRALNAQKTPQEAMAEAMGRLNGAFALAVILAGRHDLMLGGRSGAPLAVGDSATVHDASGAVVTRAIKETAASGALVGKGEFRHFMQKEIHEQPAVIGDTLNSYFNPAEQTVHLPELPFDLADVSRVSITACGTAFYAGMVGRYWLEQIARLPVDIDVASEFRYRAAPMPERGATILVSQSGETADTLAALRYARETGQQVLSVVNVPESSIARASDVVLPTHAGPEIGVASTKAFTTQLTVFACLAIAAARARGAIDHDREAALTRAIAEVPSRAAEVLNHDDTLRDLAHEVAEARDVLYLGRGTAYPLALEGALKLKEISYIHAEGYAAGEMKHGPIALIDEAVPVIVIAPSDELFEKTASNVQEVIARGGKVIFLSDKAGIKRMTKEAKPWATIELPSVDPFVAPILYAIPVQLLAYHTAVVKGTDVDQPRNLAKSVTVE
jgi:glucosamine--fructose-6-phosphate aminotransferase (isomerizing)